LKKQVAIAVYAVAMKKGEASLEKAIGIYDKWFGKIGGMDAELKKQVAIAVYNVAMNKGEASLEKAIGIYDKWFGKIGGMDAELKKQVAIAVYAVAMKKREASLEKAIGDFADLCEERFALRDLKALPKEIMKELVQALYREALTGVSKLNRIRRNVAVYALGERIAGELYKRLGDGVVDEDMVLSAEAFAQGLCDVFMGLAYHGGGVVSDAEEQALEEMRIADLDAVSLTRRYIALYDGYRKAGCPPAFIRGLLRRHLLSVDKIHGLQRTYRLGQDTSVIAQAINHPDPEAWLAKRQAALDRRGTLEEAKHLSRYHQAKGGVLSDDARARFIKRLEANVEVLMLLWERSGNTDVDLRNQLSALQKILRNIGLGKETGHPVIDRLLGFSPLTGDAAVAELPAEKFMNRQIPYDRTKEAPGDRAQEMAVNLALGPTEVALIEGPPGTGKTTALEEIVRQYVKQGKKVLVVSHDHKAVNNAIEKLIGDDTVPLLRMANDSSLEKLGTRKRWAGNERMWMRPDAGLSVDEKRMKGDCQREVKKFHDARKKTGGCVVAATNMGISTDWYFENRLKEDDFDVVIMDEASRETLAGALVPLQYLKDGGKAILVGDTKQLPPFGFTGDEETYLLGKLTAAGKSRQEAEEQIAAASDGIFEYLIDRRRGDRVMLSTNYRSHPLIAMLGSELFYDGDINPRGWEDFGRDTLSLNVIDISEKVRPKEGYERRVGTSYANDRSAEEVMQLVRKYLSQGIALRDITLITPYKAQVELLERKLRLAYPGGTDLPRVTTIDSFQGEESRAVIIDFVRSNPRRQMGFLKDLRRLNVALSRAQDRLAIVWDKETMTGEPGPADTAEDRASREKLNGIQDFWEREVKPFFYPDEEEEVYEEEETEPEITAEPGPVEAPETGEPAAGAPAEPDDGLPILEPRKGTGKGEPINDLIDHAILSFNRRDWQGMLGFLAQARDLILQTPEEGMEGLHRIKELDHMLEVAKSKAAPGATRWVRRMKEAVSGYVGKDSHEGLAGEMRRAFAGYIMRPPPVSATLYEENYPVDPQPFAAVLGDDEFRRFCEAAQGLNAIVKSGRELSVDDLLKWNAVAAGRERGMGSAFLDQSRPEEFQSGVRQFGIWWLVRKINTHYAEGNRPALPGRLAADALCAVAGGHPFKDGNHRTGVLLMLYVLAKSGLSLELDSDGAHQLRSMTERGRFDREAIFAFISRRVRKAPQPASPPPAEMLSAETDIEADKRINASP
jgi:hypothetical protein